MDKLIAQIGYLVIASFTATLLLYLITRIPRILSALSSLRNPLVVSELEKLFANSNPGMKWDRAHIIGNGQEKSIPFPIWECWVLLEDLELLNTFEGHILDKLFDVFSNSRICAITQPALVMLANLRSPLTQINSKVFPLNEHFKIPDDWFDKKLVLFDINVNTGSAMFNARSHFENKGWQISHFATMFLNDLIPKEKRVLHLPSSELSYLIKASEVVLQWKDEKSAIAEAMRTVKQADLSIRKWEDNHVIKSLELLEDYYFSLPNDLKKQ